MQSMEKAMWIKVFNKLSHSAVDKLRQTPVQFFESFDIDGDEIGALMMTIKTMISINNFENHDDHSTDNDSDDSKAPGMVIIFNRFLQLFLRWTAKYTTLSDHTTMYRFLV